MQTQPPDCRQNENKPGAPAENAVQQQAQATKVPHAVTRAIPFICV